MVRNGTESIIRKLEKDLNVTAKCQPIKGNMAERPLDNAFVEFMTRHVDWKTEALVGYRPGSMI